MAFCSSRVANASCKRGDETKPARAGVAAIVNGVELSSIELDVAHKRTTEQFANTGRQIHENFNKNLRGSILRKMIDDEIMKQRAAKDNVVVDRIERVQALENSKKKWVAPRTFKFFLSARI